MKNKTIKLMLAAGVLVVCCGVYMGVKNYVSSQEGQETQNSEKENPGEIVFKVLAGDIKEISFMIEKNEVTFEKKGDIWRKKDEEAFPVNQTILEEVVSSLTDIESDRVLEDAENLEQYGLDEPSNTIKIKVEFPVNQTILEEVVSSLTDIESDRVLEDAENLEQYGLDEPSNTIKIKVEPSKLKGDSEESVEKDNVKEVDENETTLRIGDLNEASNQYYVSKGEDRNTVYLVDSGVIEPFSKSLYEYAEGEDFPAIADTSG